MAFIGAFHSLPRPQNAVSVSPTSASAPPVCWKSIRQAGVGAFRSCSTNAPASSAPGVASRNMLLPKKNPVRSPGSGRGMGSGSRPSEKGNERSGNPPRNESTFSLRNSGGDAELSAMADAARRAASMADSELLAQAV